MKSTVCQIWTLYVLYIENASCKKRHALIDGMDHNKQNIQLKTVIIRFGLKILYLENDTEVRLILDKTSRSTYACKNQCSYK